MTDFGIERTKAVAIFAALDGVEDKLDTLHTDLGKLLAQVVHTLVNDITFDDDPTTYTSDSVAAENYRDMAVLVNLAVTGAPTDIVISIQESDDDINFHTIMNGPFGDLRYEDTAGAKKEAIHGKVNAPFLRAYVVARGTDGTKKFTLTLKVVLAK